MPTDWFLNWPQIIFSLQLSFILKGFLLLFLVFYFVLSIITLRQVQIMANTLVTPLSPLLKFMAVLNLGVSLAVIFLAINFL